MELRAEPLNLAAAKEHMHERLQTLADRVDLRITSDDGMTSDDVHYLLVGSSALNAIQSAIRLGGRPDPERILDFGCGAGRVTRWLAAAFPNAGLCGCDLRAQDVDFCREVFGAETWISGTDVEALDFHGRYDLIWMGSVLTHLDERVSRRIIDRTCESLNPGGLLVATVIGRAARAIQDREPMFLQGSGWPEVKRDYDETGYGYVDYEGEQGYGLSLSSPAWVTGVATRQTGRRIVMMSEGAWDGTQDVFAIQANATFRADPIVPTPQDREMDALKKQVDALEKQVDALESSTSWRVTSPLRHFVGAIRRMT